MKVFAVVVVVSIVALTQALTPEQAAKVKQYYGACVKETSVDEELVKKGRQGEFVEDQKLKNFVHCFFKQVGFQNEAGELQLDVIRAKIPSDVNPKEADEVIAKCKDVKGSDSADTAFQVYKCYWNATPNHISLA